MASYRLLQDHHVGGAHLHAGSVISDGPGGLLPKDWHPTAHVDPLDDAAVQAFWNAGVQLPGLMRGQWTGAHVAAPKTYWVPNPNAAPGNPYREYVLIGLGASLPHRQIL